MSDTKDLPLPERLRALATGRVEWQVIDPQTRGICMWFDRDNYLNPEREAKEWLDDQNLRFPGGKFTSYEVKKARIFSDLERAALEAADALEAAAADARAALPFSHWPQLAKDGYTALEEHLKDGPSLPLAYLYQLQVGLTTGTQAIPEYRRIGWRAVEKSKSDGLVWHSSRVVRECKDAESIVTQWQASYRRGESDPLEYGIEELFVRAAGAKTKDANG